MGAAGVFASWIAAAFGAWAFLAALSGSGEGTATRHSAERALVASAVAALSASIVLTALLLSGDVTVSYVARSIATNLPPAYRVAALWSYPSGAALPTAALVAGFFPEVELTDRPTLGQSARCTSRRRPWANP